jgi:UDP-N-acetyl-alpha-D-muramoyl-L-alanyl-L-glutamate epimerase
MPTTSERAGSRPRHAAFVFRSAALHERVISLDYALSGGPDPDVSFTETLELPAVLPVPASGDPMVRDLLDGIHRTFGVSYYKCAVPRQIIAPPVSGADAQLWDLLYTEGLGEFYYTNQLDPAAHTGFPSTEPAPGTSDGPARPRHSAPDDKALILVGGGKDSAVVREIARHAGVEASAFSLGSSPWIVRSAAAMGLPHWTVRRTLDPKLREMNRLGAWNGHVPISACIASLAMLVAHLAGYGYILAGNERSADDQNLTWRGLSVNHQWSKSLIFERQFAAWCDRHAHDGARYFSLLRPLTEVRIAEAFASHRAYFAHFASCNGNFRLEPGGDPPRWCGTCPKCVFVYLVLAPHLGGEDLTAIFGGDFLRPPSNAQLLERLAGVTGFKPFECVGTAEETQASLTLLARQGRLPDAVRRWYEETVAPRMADPDALLKRLRAPDGPHGIPPIWQERLHAYLATQEP